MDRTTLNGIVNEYAGHLQAEKGLASASRERYVALARGLLALCEHDPAALFLPSEWGLADLDRRVVESYLNTLKAERRWKPMSVAYYITALSAFFRFLKSRNHVTRNPCTRLRPRLSGELEALPEGEAEVVMRMFEEPADTLDGARRLLLLELLYGAGLRPSQAFRIAALEVPAAPDAPAALEAPAAQGPVRVRLGEAWYELALSPEGVARAARYGAKRAEVLESGKAAGHPAKTEAFWIDRRGRPCSPARLARQVTRAMQAQGLTGGPATLRVLAARHFGARGADVRSVQQLLKARRLGRLDRFQPAADLKALTDQFRRAHPRQTAE